MLVPLYAYQLLTAPIHDPTGLELAGLVYVGLGASVIAFIFWNKGVLAVGANAAGFTRGRPRYSKVEGS
jgi:drug/metabolite transporter (DMT)-like permease